MCINFVPATPAQIANAWLGVLEPPAPTWPEETYPGYDAPIVVRSERGDGLQCLTARFGLTPRWARDAALTCMSVVIKITVVNRIISQIFEMRRLDAPILFVYFLYICWCLVIAACLPASKLEATAVNSYLINDAEHRPNPDPSALGFFLQLALLSK